MNTVDDARYRLTLADGQLADAEKDYDDQRWHLCVASAQSAAENAGKAIIACFLPIEKTHEPVKQIEAMLEEDIIPIEVRQTVVKVLPALRGLGRKLHIQATYGDENSYTLPWDLFDAEKAQVALQAARQSVTAAQQVYQLIFDTGTDDSALHSADN
jgi:HEPN domain-containing protein